MFHKLRPAATFSILFKEERALVDGGHNIPLAANTNTASGLAERTKIEAARLRERSFVISLRHKQQRDEVPAKWWWKLFFPFSAALRPRQRRRPLQNLEVLYYCARYGVLSFDTFFLISSSILSLLFLSLATVVVVCEMICVYQRYGSF